MIRSFIAIEIPAAIRQAIGRMITEWDQAQYPVRWVKADNLHLTLKFLGEISEPVLNRVSQKIKSISERFAPFRFSLQELGCFPSPKSPRVIWIGAAEGKKEVTSLQQIIEQELALIGLKPEAREFSPHLTLGRANARFDPQNILATRYESSSFSVESLVLFKSTLTPGGPIYDKLQEFPFTGKG